MSDWRLGGGCRLLCGSRRCVCISIDKSHWMGVSPIQHTDVCDYADFNLFKVSLGFLSMGFSRIGSVFGVQEQNVCVLVAGAAVCDYGGDSTRGPLVGRGVSAPPSRGMGAGAQSCSVATSTSRIASRTLVILRGEGGTGSLKQRRQVAMYISAPPMSSCWQLWTVRRVK